MMGASCWQGDQEGKGRRGESEKGRVGQEEISTAIIFSPFLVAGLPPATRLSKMAAGRRSPILKLKLPSLNLKQSHPQLFTSPPPHPPFSTTSLFHTSSELRISRVVAPPPGQRPSLTSGAQAQVSEIEAES